MGQDVTAELDPDAIRHFTKAILNDLQALKRMMSEGLIETGVRRFGAEQEVFLVNQGWRPAPVGPEVLERLSGGAFTTELARFNLEINLEPRLLEGKCFEGLHARLDELLEQVREAARAEKADVALAGILPTLGKSDLSLENITPKARYFALNEALTRMRGGAYRLRIEGTDELNIEHDSVMLESCNTSCQVHLQVSSEEFARFYNAAQLATAPVVAAAGNSPLLFGKRLWSETRIALFQQSLDTRSTTLHLRELAPRVRFGDDWCRDGVMELFEEDVARFRVILATAVDEDPFETLDRGGVPRLQALQLHNSTVYRWNRPCYGISDGRAHVRIECRALPSGPSVVDEVANAAFWLGLVIGTATRHPGLHEEMDFDNAKANFIAASRLGLNAALQWVEGEAVGASPLILNTLLPLAAEGLQAAGVDSADGERYLDVIRRRVESGMTGSAWVLKSIASMKHEGTRSERLGALTSATVKRQKEGKPVHEWDLATLDEAGGWKQNYLRVEQYMGTSLLTVNEHELVDLVAFLMDREQVRHVPVEDDEHQLVGLVSYRSILRIVAEGKSPGSYGETETPPVREIMETNLTTVTPETPTLEAIDLMRTRRVACLPVLKDGKLVGLVTERDFMSIAYQLLEERLTAE